MTGSVSSLITSCSPKTLECGFVVDDFQMTENVPIKDSWISVENTETSSVTSAKKQGFLASVKEFFLTLVAYIYPYVKSEQLTLTKIDQVIESGQGYDVTCPVSQGRPMPLSTMAQSLTAERDAQIYLNSREGTAFKTGIFPVGVMDRGFLREGHAVLAVMLADQTIIIDSKNNNYSSTQHNISTINTGFQSVFDTKNCGLYTAWTAIALAKTLPENATIDDVKQAVAQIECPTLNDLNTLKNNR